jgi:hypothetical protein
LVIQSSFINNNGFNGNMGCHVATPFIIIPSQKNSFIVGMAAFAMKDSIEWMLVFVE